MSDTSHYWFEARIVDGELPMEYWNEESDTVEIFAESRAHARLAVRVVYGDRYEVVDFTMANDLDSEPEIDAIDDPVAFADTELGSWHDQLNAFEAFAEGGFRVSYYDENRDRVDQRADTLAEARTWFRENAPEDETAMYEGWSDVGGESFVQSLPARYVDQYLDGDGDAR